MSEKRDRGQESRARAVNGVTLADLHAQGAYLVDAARRMGWGQATVRKWERDTGKRFARLDREERSRRAAAAITPEERERRSRVMQTPEARARSSAVLRRLWDDPEKSAEMVRKRAATYRANPEACAKAAATLRAAEPQRLAAIRAMMADPMRWGAAKARMAAAHEARWRDPAAREKQAAVTAEARRRMRVNDGLAQFRAGALNEEAARRLLRDMTAEERLLLMMQVSKARAEA